MGPRLSCPLCRSSPHDHTRKRRRRQKNLFHCIQASNILSYMLNASRTRTKEQVVANHSSLTSRQLEIYEFIRDKMEKRGYPPTVREIGVAFEIKSPNGVM